MADNSIPIQAPDGTVRLIPSAQKDAAVKAGGKPVVKMLDPKGTARWIPSDQQQAALAAGGKIATPDAIDVHPEEFRTPESPWANLNNEGTYKLQKGKEEIDVPYSKVHDAITQGYSFADHKEGTRFAKDYLNDTSTVRGKINAVADFPTNMQIGAIKEGRKTVGGTMDIVAKWLRSQTLPTDIAAYQKEHPGATEEDARAALSPHAEKIQKVADAVNAETDLHGIGEQAGGLAEQVGELLLPETAVGKVAEGTKLARGLEMMEGADIASKPARIAVKTLAEGGKAAAEQGAQQYVKSGGDTEQAKEAAEFGAFGGAAGTVAPEVAKAAGRFSSDVGRFFLGVGDIQVNGVVRKTLEKNDAIETRAAKIIEDNNAKIAKYRDDVKAAQEKAASTTASAEEKAAAAKTEQDAKVAAAKLAHDNEVAKQEALAAQRAVATRARYELRSRLAQRVQAIRDSAKAYFNKAYSDISEKVGNRSVPVEDLADVVYDAQKHFQGSAENVKPFKDILDKVKRLEKLRDAEEIPTEDLAPDELAQLRKDEGEHGVKSGFTFDDLRGYYSEAGRMLASDSTAPDVKQALVKFRDDLDKLQGDLAGEAGVGQEYKLVRNRYRNYADGFLDYQGPNKSGSPVALGLKAEDPYNAVRPYLGKEPEELSRIKQILVGKPTDATTQFTEGTITTPSGKKEPAWRYRKDSAKLLDNLIAAEKTLKDLPKAKDVGEFVAPEAKPIATVEPTEPKEIEPPKLKPVPQNKQLSPEKLQKLKTQMLEKRAQMVSHFGQYAATLGLVGAVAGFLFPHKDTTGAVEHGLEGLVVGAISPYLIARMLEKPGVVESLSKVSQKDLKRLMQMPPEDRPGVEAALKKMAEQAEKTGKLKKPSPWLRIVGGELGKDVGTAGTPNIPSGGTTTQQLDDISQQLGVTQ